MSYFENSLKGFICGIIRGSIIGLIKGDTVTRSFDCSSSKLESKPFLKGERVDYSRELFKGYEGGYKEVNFLFMKGKAAWGPFKGGCRGNIEICQDIRAYAQLGMWC